MVNRPLSNLGIKLDNFGAKALKTRKQKVRMMADAVQVEPVFTPEFFANREINNEFFGNPASLAIFAARTANVSRNMGRNHLMLSTGNPMRQTGNSP